MVKWISRKSTELLFQVRVLTRAPMFETRTATHDDVPTIMAIFDKARGLMKKHGNPEQWEDWPRLDFVRGWIDAGTMYVVVKGGEIAGTFTVGEHYAEYDNPGLKWLNDAPYIFVGCFALATADMKIIKHVVDWCVARCKNVRVDTGAKNYSTQHLLKRHGFVPVGSFMPTTYDGVEMIAFHLATK